jgi:GT2 family glycosyltransferase/glycosyltransferase involved in cell wall biosynthesis
MKIGDIILKLKIVMKRKRKECIRHPYYTVKSLNIRITDIPKSVFLVIRKYGFVVFLHKSKNYVILLVKKYINKLKRLREHSVSSIRREGAKKTFIRIFHYIVYGKGVLHKKEIINRDEFNLKPYNVSVVENLQISEIKPIEFEKKQNPKVSIVIPVYNKWNYTYNCLRSIKKNVNDVLFEVIIVDDCSTDETALMIDKIKNVVYLKNIVNKGFVGSCNAGAQIARGEFIVFLNNDTFVKRGWLRSLVDTFVKNAGTGLVGSKLIYGSGLLQEAGGIVWKNQNVWNYGRLGNPENYEFNYVKEVDYCSGASIMVLRSLFEKLNGFDESFAPGYFEDTDLAFRIRQAGYRVLYQPLSEVYHFEGVTSGTDLNSGMKRYQQINKSKFFDRWNKILLSENLNDEIDGPFLARDRSKNKKVVLFVDNNIPTFDKDAGSFIAFQYLKVLVDLNFKVIFWPYNLQKLMPYAVELQQIGIETIYGNENFEKFITANGKYLDYAIVSRPHIAAECLDIIKLNSNAKILYIPHDLHFLRETRELEISNDDKLKKQIIQTKKSEQVAFEKSSSSLFFSDKEVEIVNKEFPGAEAVVVPWIQNIENPKPSKFEKRNGLVFIGGYNHKPNVDAVLWFHDKIFPKLKEKITDLKVYLYGSNPPAELEALNTEDFVMAGFIEEDNIKEIFDKAKIFIAPLRYGAGFKGKIAKAMSNGLPVVTTEIGAEGIGITDGFNSFIADNPNEFAEKVFKLYTDEQLWNKFSSGSIEHVKTNFSFEAAKNRLNNIMQGKMI